MSKCSSDASKTLAFFLLACFVLCFFPVQAHAASYVTNEFDIAMDVREDNSFYMTYKVSVDFNYASHGIFAYIPLGREYKIDKVRATGDRYETYRENGNIIVKIGDPDVFVRGEKEYTIEYRCRFYKDTNPDNDFLYWNLLSPKGWDTDIESFRVRINMPKPFDEEYVRITGGRAGSTELADMDVSFKGRMITAESRSPVKYGDGLTLAIQLPEGYFEGVMTDTWMFAVAYLLSALAAILAFALWFLFGRAPRIVKTVEFYPPEGITPAEAGYVIDGYIDSKDMAAMIIYFADQGCLAIEESGQKKEIILKKVKSLPAGARNYERMLFNGLFADGDSVNLAELKGSFYPRYKAAVSQLRSFFRKPENKVFKLSLILARLVGVLLAIVPLSLFALIALHVKGLEAILLLQVIVFVFLGGIAFVHFRSSKYSSSTAKRRVSTVLHILFLAIMYAEFIALGTLFFKLGAFSIGAAICSAAPLLFTEASNFRTKKGVEILGKLLGFKEFIQRAELDRLKRLVDENPSYFYSILPYAYVFGLSSKWADNFKGIAIKAPEWYSPADPAGFGTFNSVVFMRSFNKAATSIKSGIAVPPNSGGSSDSGFGGGGFSSSSTGGGSGGFGGGRW
ncbi:MAG: DUF2207 domain-containing protein [Clostridiales bacterium]|nr:DUF2207 domain-containing protein [Clostridiales bacterium]